MAALALVIAALAVASGPVAVTGSSMPCLQADGKWAPCGPGNDQCGPALQHGPQFHLTDQSCGMNDPNGPFYDPLHKL
jgi:hypothetical protein